jgi:hypothetical protein
MQCVNEKSGLGDLTLNRSLGVRLEGGMDYNVLDPLIISATVWNIALMPMQNLAAYLSFIKISPWTYRLSIGYFISVNFYKILAFVLLRIFHLFYPLNKANQRRII